MIYCDTSLTGWDKLTLRVVAKQCLIEATRVGTVYVRRYIIAIVGVQLHSYCYKCYCVFISAA